MLQEQIVSSAPQVVGSFSLFDEFDAPVYNPSLPLHVFFRKKRGSEWLTRTECVDALRSTKVAMRNDGEPAIKQVAAAVRRRQGALTTLD